MNSNAAARPRTTRRLTPLRIAAMSTALVVVAGGSAVAVAHKTVTLDVDGEVVQVSTFAGSVEGVLADNDVTVGERDEVVPSLEESLRSGDEVVVRTARQVTVDADGDEARVWTTALTADEVLATLAGRGDDVRLVASRSSSAERADLSVLLADAGPVLVLADGETHEVADGSQGLSSVLAGLDLTVGELDRVSVGTDEDSGQLTVVLERVTAEERTSTREIEFESRTEQTDELFVGESRVATEGRPGERTRVHRLILVDGEEESRVLLSDRVTREPRTHVVQEGSKARPAPRPTATRAPSSSSGSSSGSGGGSSSSGGSSSGTSSSVGDDVWAQLARCESGGNPSIVSSNGLYHGLYQFRVDTWRSVGGSGLPSEATPAEQTERAKILQARSGWGQWPACSSKLGLR
ncbi:transglycosylase family protein [Cellulomonas bogoriensis]